MQVIGQWNGRNIADLLRLERLDRDLFRNHLNQINLNASLFGGQVLAQALSAALRTVDDSGGASGNASGNDSGNDSRARHVHSLHGYFLRAGQGELPVLYQVERTRDGGRFSTRRVVAIQEGEPIFHMECGFHAEEEGFEHQVPLPSVVSRPEQLKPLLQLVEELGERVPAWLQQWDRRYGGQLDVRPVDPEGFFRCEDGVPRRSVWMRVPGAAGSPRSGHACVLAWMSDHWLAGTSALPYMAPGRALFMASLDHAMWFHRPVDTSGWLLFDTDSPSAQAGRGLSRALIYAEDGRLVASAVQEALLRQRRPA